MDASINLIKQFCSVTGCDVSEARAMLTACGDDLQLAIEMHMDGSSASHSNRDADQQVRAPIPQKFEVLQSPAPLTLPYKRRRTNDTSVFDQFRDFQAEANHQEEMLKGESSSSHANTLKNLFSPPCDLMHQGTLISAEACAQRDNKWIMVNVQDPCEFACHILNRDIWKDATVKGLIKKHFIFWQVYINAVEGKNYAQFHSVDSWPYVVILHPVTGELMKKFTKWDIETFTHDLRNYLSEHLSPDGIGNKVNQSEDQSTPSIVCNSVIDETEQSQIEAAIQASLKEAERKQRLGSDSDDESISYNSLPSSSDDEHSLHSSDSDISTHDYSKPDEVDDQKTCNGSPSCADTTKGIGTNAGWKDYLSDEGTEMVVAIRFPDQSKQVWCAKSKSRLKALFLYVEELGFPSSSYEIITTYPRRQLSALQPQLTLSQAGFQSQETCYVQAV